MDTLGKQKSELDYLLLLLLQLKRRRNLIMGIHDFGAYLSSGLPNGDRSVTEISS